MTSSPPKDLCRQGLLPRNLVFGNGPCHRALGVASTDVDRCAGDAILAPRAAYCQTGNEVCSESVLPVQSTISIFGRLRRTRCTETGRMRRIERCLCASMVRIKDMRQRKRNRSHRIFLVCQGMACISGVFTCSSTGRKISAYLSCGQYTSKMCQYEAQELVYAQCCHGKQCFRFS